MKSHAETRKEEIKAEQVQPKERPVDDPNGAYSVSMSLQQWDLIVMALGYVKARAFEPTKPADFQPIDIWARRLVRKRVSECMAEIQSNVPSAGAGE